MLNRAIENLQVCKEERIHKYLPYMIVCDVIPNRKTTRFLDAAREAGCKTFSGLDMLVNQGIRCFELWTGEKAPVEVMAKALKREYGIED